jgi:membrane-associated phospholipid phosphatase
MSFDDARWARVGASATRPSSVVSRLGAPWMRRGRPAAIATSFALLAGAARADTNLDERQSDAYYAARAGAVVGVSGLTIAATALLHPEPPAPTPSEWLSFDEAMRGRLSTAASTASDVTLVTTIFVPLGAELASGVSTSLANTSIIYAEVLAANALLNTIVKYSVLRPRPYNYRKPPATEYVASQGVDAYLSFYSGHSSTAFASAIAGSYLFSAAHDGSAASPWLWGTEMALATATALWRIRAGKHFYSDVAVGILVGSAIGIGIPLAEGVRYRPTATEMAFAGGGVLLGGLTAVLAPFHDDVATALRMGPLHVQILPLVTAQRTGLTLRGDF